jgi:hypothetical protein
VPLNINLPTNLVDGAAGHTNAHNATNTAVNQTAATVDGHSTTLATLAGGGGAGVDAADVGYDLILLLGQSNMAGAASFDAVHYDVTDPRVQQYGALGSSYASVISHAVDPLAYPATVPGQGPGLHFARWYLNSVPPNRRVLLVPAAYPGTPLSSNVTPLSWRRGVSGNLYAKAVTQAAAALAAAGAHARYAAALWVHSDNLITGSQYQTDLDALIAGLRTDLSAPTLPFVIGQMVPEYLTGTRAAINTVQAAVGTRLAYTAFANGPTSANQGDGNHYNDVGMRALGRSMFNAYLVALANTSVAPPPAPAAPTGLAASNVAGTTLTLTWTAPSGLVTSYIVEQKLTSGSTWAQIGTPSVATLNVTGLTVSTSYDFRVSAVNAGGTSPTSSVLTQATGTTPALTNSSLPTITGTATEGQTLTAGNGTWSATPDSYTYQWKRAGVNISGATGSTYLLVTADVSSTITVTVTAVKSGYTSGSATSNPTGAVNSSGTPTTYAADTFTRADSATLGSTETGANAWTATGGTWAIAANTMTVANATGGVTCTINDGQANGTFSVKLGSSTGASLYGLHFRGTAPSNGYILFRDGDGTLALRTRSGFQNVAGTGPLGSGVTVGDTITVIVNGTSITVKLNGTTLTTVTDSAFSGTVHGLFAYDGTAAFDNFSHTSATT